MKRLYGFLTALLFISTPFIASATVITWDYAGGILQPLKSARSAVVKGASFTATSTTANVFPYASSTALSATTLCLSTDCRTSWPSGSGTTVGTVSTSTTPTIGQLAYWTSTAYPSLLGTVATTTRSFSGPFTVTGTSGYLVGGTNSTITWTGLATTSQPSSSNLLVSDGAAGVYGVATSSVSFTGPFTVPTTLGKLVGGSGSIAWTGLATSSAITSGQVLYGTSASGVASVATSSLAVGSSLSVSSGSLGYQIGGTNATIGLNLANSNTWTVLQNFNYSSSTIYSSFAAASSTNWLGGGLSTCTGANHLQWSAGFFSCAADPVGGNVATSAAETNGRLAYWTTTSGTPAKLGTVATTTLSVSGPLGITAARGTLVGGSNATISWSGLSTTTAISSGQLLYGTSVSGVSSVATSTLAVGSSLSVASGAFGYQVGGSNVTFGLNLGNSNSWSALQTFTAASTTHLTAATSLQIPNAASIASTVAGYLGLDTTDNQLKAGTGSSQVVFDQRRFLTFGYSTTTWSGTTTIPLGFTPAAMTMNTIQCSTDVGTVEVRFYYGPTPTSQYLQASTTPGVTTWASNNTPGAAASTTVQIGNPASSPTQVSCTISGMVTGT